MFRSAGVRFIVVGVLALLMFIPLGLVGEIVQDRSRYSETTIRDISREWGGAQLINGPVMVIPVTEDVTYDRKREAVDPTTGRTLRDAENNIVYEHYSETVTESRAPVFLYPRRLDIDASTQTQIRHRGIFEVPVYTAEVALGFDFDTDLISGTVRNGQVVHWTDAELRVYLNSNRALRGEAVLEADAKPLALEPIPETNNNRTGIFSVLGDPRKLNVFELRLSMNGAQNFGATAVGRTSRVNISSDWPDPSFYGSFLPDGSEISDDGFSASWTVPHLARSLPQVSREDHANTAANGASMQVRFITTNDFYQKAWRSARYGILFIALTFLTILLLDRSAERPAHPVQYLLVGLAQSIFVLLMLAYSEQIGFTGAYLLAAGATITLLTLFGATALKLKRRTFVLFGMLVTVYAVLFFILQSADFALLAGATLAFLALALTMWMTRNEDWHGPERKSRWSLFKPSQSPPSQAAD